VWFTGPLLPNNLAGTSGQVLTSAGAGVVPTWTTPTTGTVTGVTATSPVASSGGTAPAISLNAAYGDTLNPYASKTANFILAAPNGSAGVPSFRAIVAADIPTLNQNTTGTAANVTGTVAVANGGTGLTSVTANRLLYGNGTSALQTSANFTYNGTTQAITAGAATALSLTTSGSTASLLVTDTGGNGAGIGLSGNGATTPNKYIRAIGGTLQVVNNAYSAVIFQLSDTGVISSSTWNGVTIGVAYGGTGLTSVGTTGNVLTSNGTAWVSSALDSNITTKGLYENNATISANYTIATGNNAVSAGPITINSGIVVTVPSGSTWVVV
jgi:hypothetical protein